MTDNLEPSRITQMEQEIANLIGACEVERLKTGKYIVLFMSLVSSPPPVADTPEEAMEKFLEWYQNNRTALSPQLPGLEDTDENK